MFEFRKQIITWLICGLTFVGLVSDVVHAQNSSTPIVPKPLTSVEKKLTSKDIPRLNAETISIPLNKAHFIQLPEPIRDVIIANPNIADVLVKTPNNLYLIGKALGRTNVFLLGADGQITRHIVIDVESDIIAARKAIKSLLPDANVDVKGIGDSLVLTGTVRSANESEDAATVARRFVEQDSNVINMLRILKDLQVLLQVRVAEMQRTTIKNLSASTSSAVFCKSISMVNVKSCPA